jgi:hypothetical protein
VRVRFGIVQGDDALTSSGVYSSPRSKCLICLALFSTSRCRKRETAQVAHSIGCMGTSLRALALRQEGRPRPAG